MKYISNKFWILYCFCYASILTAAIPDYAGKFSGYALFIGSPKVTILKELTNRGTFSVQCLVNQEQLATAQKTIHDNQISGMVTAASFTTATLPYTSSIYDIIIVDDANLLSSLSISKNELLRILAPEGVLLTGTAPNYNKEVKPLSGTSTQNHDFNYAMTKNFSDNSALQLPFELRWLNGPRWAQTLTQGLLAQISSGGVYYQLTKLAMGNEITGTNTITDPMTQPFWIVARNAYNGLILWEIPCELTKRLSYNGSGPSMGIAADQNRLYYLSVNKVIGVNKLTGTKEIETPTFSNFSFMGITSKALVVGTSTAITGYSLVNGTSIWNFPLNKNFISWKEANGLLFLHLTNTITVLQSETGVPVWSKPLSEFVNFRGIVTTERNSLGLLTATQFFMYAQNENRQIWAADVSRDYGATPLIRFFDDKIQIGTDVFTAANGTPINKYSRNLNFFSHKCQIPTLTPNYIIDTRINVFSYDSVLLKSYPYTRTPCVSGVFIANGLIYGTPEDCVCNGDQIMSNLAIGTSSKEVTAADFTTVRQPIRGTAAAPTQFTTGEYDWPTLHGNTQRSLSTSAQSPSKLNLMGIKQVTNPKASTPVSLSWRSSGTFGMTPPVVVGNMLYVADVEGATMYGLSTSDLSTVWSFTCEGRISSPPTIYQGNCLFGSHDGYIYCLRADNGGLVWKNRVAPIEKRIPAYGLMESPWPAASGVVVVKDTAFIMAGQSVVSEGGFAIGAFKLSDGTMYYGANLGVHQNNIFGIMDVLKQNGTAVLFKELKIGKTVQGAGTTNTIESCRMGLLDYTASFRKNDSWRSKIVPTQLRSWASGTQLIHQARILPFDNDYAFVAGSVCAQWGKPITDDPKAELYSRSSLTPLWTYTYGSDKAVLAAGMYANACVLVLGTYDKPKVISKADIILLNRTNAQVMATLTVNEEPVFGGIALKNKQIYLSCRSGKILSIGEGTPVDVITVRQKPVQNTSNYSIVDIRGRIVSRKDAADKKPGNHVSGIYLKVSNVDKEVSPWFNK